MEDRIVQILRICELKKGDLFMWQGLWREVVSISNERLKYITGADKKNRDSISGNSRQFVEAYKNIIK